MRYLITGVALVIGITLLLTSFVVGKQFRELATAGATPTLDGVPLLEFIAGDLMSDPNVSPQEMAGRVQQRLGLVALGGLAFVLVGIAFFAMTKPNKDAANTRGNTRGP
jgi:hypothetical protein